MACPPLRMCEPRKRAGGGAQKAMAHADGVPASRVDLEIFVRTPVCVPVVMLMWRLRRSGSRPPSRWGQAGRQAVAARIVDEGMWFACDVMHMALPMPLQLPPCQPAASHIGGALPLPSLPQWMLAEDTAGRIRGPGPL